MKSVKEISWDIKNDLKEKGVEVSISQILEAMSKSLGHRNYNTAKAVDPEVMGHFTPIDDSGFIGATIDGTGLKTFDVEVESLATLKMNVQVKANSFEEARARVEKFVDYNEKACRDLSGNWGFEHFNGAYAISDIHGEEGHVQDTPIWSAYLDKGGITKKNLPDQKVWDN